MEIHIYNSKGEKVGSENVSQSILSLQPNRDLIHQVAVAYMANARSPIAHTKDRSDVRGGGKKPWRQKGTGRARHGSIRSPIWKGGGVAFGPRSNRNYSQKINKKMSDRAFKLALSSRLSENAVLLMEGADFSNGKTKAGSMVLDTVLKGFPTFRKSSPRRDSLLVVLANDFENASRALRNIPGVSVVNVKNINLIDILTHNYLIMDKSAFDHINK